MIIPSTLFDGRSIADIERDLVAGKEVSSDIGFTMTLDASTGALVVRHPELTVMGFPSSTTVGNAIIGVYKAMFAEGLLEGFQVENEDHDLYDDRCSFEVLSFNMALDDWSDAQENDPEGGWYINPLKHGDVEEPTFLDY